MDWLERIGLAWLALGCIVIGVVPQLLLRAAGTVTGALLGQRLNLSSSFLWLAPIATKQASYSGALLLAGLVVVVALTFGAIHPANSGAIAMANSRVAPCCRPADWRIKMSANTTGQQQVALPANLPSTRLCVDRHQWSQITEELQQSAAHFLSLLGSDDRDRELGFRINAAYLLPDAVLVVEHCIADISTTSYPSIAPSFPTALRMQRAVYDLLGISTDELDTRSWLRHGGWPETVFPLRCDIDGSKPFPATSEPYPFVSVQGDGVHEISVCPVHGGTIEPGKFRCSVVGETVLRLEETLGYTHKGVAKLFESLQQQDAHRLAARVSGYSAVAFSWAYCSTLEAVTSTLCPPRSIALRALALEHGRLANQLADLGALGNDAGFAFRLTHFSAMKETCGAPTPSPSELVICLTMWCQEESRSIYPKLRTPCSSTYPTPWNLL